MNFTSFNALLGTVSCILMIILVAWFLFSVSRSQTRGINAGRPRAEVIDATHIRVRGNADKLQREFGFANRGWTHVGKNEWIIELSYTQGDSGMADYITRAINEANNL